MRVYELAKELNLGSKSLVVELKKMGVPIKTHMGSVTEEQAEAARKELSGGAPAKPKKKQADKKATTRKPASKTAAAKKPVAKTPPPAEKPAEIEAEEISETVKETGSAQTVVERRVSTTVIRRRKKVKAPPPPEPPAEEAAAESEAPAAEVLEPAAAAEPAVPAEEKEAAAAEPEKPPEEPSAAEAAPPPEKPPEEPPVVVKKLRLKEKESTPARIIDRIDLGPKKEAAPPAEKVVAAPAPTGAAAVRRKPGEPVKEAEKEKKAGAKTKSRRKKFDWQKEGITEEETEKAPVHHKRVRYKIKEKSTGRGKRHKAEVIALDRRGGEPEKTVPKAIKRKIRLQEGISVADLAKRMGVKAGELIKKLVELGVMATINQVIDVETASLVATDFGYEVESVSIEEEQIFEDQPQEAEQDLQPRCPVVTVMGHVDHGKTSLLDVIRKTRVVDGEAGGITQHIGAYRVGLKSGDIAFVDTPGHEAFTTMRARGAQVTDIVILVVAAEEGAKPQTIEAINHARAADVPIIVAINKIDKPEANPEKVRQELSQHGLLAEDWGGEDIFVEVSAKNNTGIEKLLEMVLLQAEILELKANPNKPAKGTIVEARLDRGRGPIATVLVQEGTLRAGDSFVSRHNFGKVRALIDDHGKNIPEAGPSTPVEVLGFSSVPEAGDVFVAVDDRKARQTGQYWQQKKREDELRKDARVSLENFFSAAGETDVKELRIIIKSDVQGSAEALKQSLENLSTDEVKVLIIHNSVGAVSQNDVMLASASGAVIIGFGVKTESKVMDAAEKEKVDVRIYNIIYEVIDEVRKAMVGLLAPKYVEKTSGKAEIREVFEISKYGTVAGCFVLEGKVVKGSKARVIRADEVVHESEITSLKRFKDDAKEALSGQDCGIFLGNYSEFQVGDIIESFFMEEVERTL